MPGDPYQVALPISVEGKKRLGDLYGQDMMRFKSLQRKFQCKPEFASTYRSVMSEYFTLGQAEIVQKDQLNLPASAHYFLPHHGVPKKGPEQVRVVFNASAPTASGVFLNDILPDTPNNLQEIPAVITDWRSSEVIFGSDIKKMYRQIRLRPPDRDYHRFLWQFEEGGPIVVCRLVCVTSGSSHPAICRTKPFIL